ncbi:MAG: hypothetical protein C5B58_04710 [Acidobacteria bacterium]|nr:MAG: hypothetical protein C5B58_04710 [Acidobacteriota bacterium]
MTSSNRGTTAISRQQNRAGSLASRNRQVSNRQTPAAAVQRAMANHHVFARHDANWHRDSDKHRVHFDHNHIFVFVNGFWWGLDPWDYPYPYDPYDYYNSYPYDYYGGYPYDYYDYSSPYDNDQQSSYDDSAPPATNPTVSAVQSELAELGYYQGPIDGVLGDNTEAAIARYQEDHDLSVTGTVTTAILQSLGVPRTSS